MNIIQLESLRPATNRAARFEGMQHSANNSFFVVTSAPGQGVNKHRHPYEEIFIILEGNIKVVIDGEIQTIRGGCVTIIPAGAWHEFKNVSDNNALMVTLHDSDRIIQEDWSE